MDFIPNWQTKGFKSKADAWKHVVEELIKNRKSIISRGVTDEASFVLGNETFIIKNKNAKPTR